MATLAFDFEFSFCVEADGGGVTRGLDPLTEFISDVATYGGSQGELLEWFPANAAGDGVIGTSIVSADRNTLIDGIAKAHTVNASDLRIQNTNNGTFEFAVIYNTERVVDIDPTFSEFPGCFSIDTAFVRVVVSTIPATSFNFSGITEDPSGLGAGTTFSFFDVNGSTEATNGVVFNITTEGGTFIANHTAIISSSKFRI